MIQPQSCALTEYVRSQDSSAGRRGDSGMKRLRGVLLSRGCCWWLLLGMTDTKKKSFSCPSVTLPTFLTNPVPNPASPVASRTRSCCESPNIICFLWAPQEDIRSSKRTYSGVLWRASLGLGGRCRETRLGLSQMPHLCRLTFSEYLLSTYYRPGTVLDTGDAAVNQQTNISVLWSFLPVGDD